MKIEEIQVWEKSFSKRKGIPDDYEQALKIATLKLGEEVGEVYKAILENEWDEVLLECVDVLVFITKIANIMEKYHNTEKFSEVIKKKIDYSETRTYNSEINKFDKPI